MSRLQDIVASAKQQWQNNPGANFQQIAGGFNPAAGTGGSTSPNVPNPTNLNSGGVPNPTGLTSTVQRTTPTTTTTTTPRTDTTTSTPQEDPNQRFYFINPNTGAITNVSAASAQGYRDRGWVETTSGARSTTPSAPTFAGQTSFTPSATGFQPVDPSNAANVMANEIFNHLKAQNPGMSNEALSLMAQQRAQSMTGQVDPSLQQRLDQLQGVFDDEALRAQGELERERIRMMSATDQRVRQFGEQIDPMFDEQRMLARQQADQRTSINERMLGARGGLTSAYGAQQLEGIQQDLTTVLRSIESEKESKMALYRAQLEGADAETLSALRQNVMRAQQAAAEMRANSIQWLMQAEQAAREAGDANMMAFYEQMAAAIVQESPRVNEEASRQAGYFIDEYGNYITGPDGKFMKYDANQFQRGGITDIGGQRGMVVFDSATGTSTFTALGPAPSKGPGPSGGKWVQTVAVGGRYDGQKIMQRQNADGTISYQTVSGTPIPNNQMGGPVASTPGGGTINNPQITPSVTTNAGSLSVNKAGGSSSIQDWYTQ